MALKKNVLARIPALLLLVTGGLFAFGTLAVGFNPYPEIDTALFLDIISVPFSNLELGKLHIPIRLDNYIVFQYFNSIPPAYTLGKSYVFGGLIFLVSVSVLALFSQFKKIPFISAGIAWILLLTLVNANELNIGGLGSNDSLIILISGTLLPVIYFHVWRPHADFWTRWVAILFSSGGAVVLLILLSPVPDPALYLSEQALVLGLGFSIAWLFWQGHAIISGMYILLARVNQNLNIKISVHITVIFLTYFLVLILLLLDMKGAISLPFPRLSPLWFIFPIGILGWYSTCEKLRQELDIAAPPTVLKSIFLLGFAVVLWTVWKLDVSSNQPAEDLIEHVLIYSQIGFSIFFFVYLIANFLPVMNSGKAIHAILYKPYSVAYYHLRIGGAISMLIILIYMELIIVAQTNSLYINILADYHYQTGQTLEASILYENSWGRYRHNPKAKNATAHLLFELDQPTLAKEHLEQSFTQAPQTENILLISKRLHREGKLFEAIYYLENGLKVFPKDPLLANNLARYYMLAKKYEDAASLLSEFRSFDKTSQANWTALQTKLGVPPRENIAPDDLIFQVNFLASKHLKGKKSKKELKKNIRQQLKNEKSTMLAQAGYRNLSTETNYSNISEEVHLLDSLSHQENFIDYTMQLQETTILRSLGAGRVMETVKNLNGLAFRNPTDAAYYLHLTAMIQAQQLDFAKASRDLVLAEEKGFRAIRPFHLAILRLGGLEDKAREFSSKYPQQDSISIDQDTEKLARFNERFPEDLFLDWKSMDANANNELKAAFARKLLAHKAHGLTKSQLKELGAALSQAPGAESLQEFLRNPDRSQEGPLRAFCKFLDVGEELSANPYLTPLVLSAAERTEDPIRQYEILNAASDFNRDPHLWIHKIQAAKRIGLDHYANAALQEMHGWLDSTKISDYLSDDVDKLNHY